ncbi:MAG: ammonium transporter [Nitrospirota bacterium]
MARSDQILWLLVANTFTLLTIPGVALFYSGMVRRKNALNAMALPLSALLLASIGWLCADDASGVSRAVGLAPDSGQDAGSLPSIFSAVAAALALALVAGAVVERIRLPFFLLFGTLWMALVYAPLASWLWGGGWLANLGSLDFAGGAVIHISAGVAALVAAILIGPRKGFGRTDMMPHHLPLSICGAGFMWVGWWGFAGRPGAASMTAVTGAFVAIQLAAASAALAWTAAEWLQRDKPTALGTVSGAVAGLVAIAPAAGYVGPLSAMVIGIGAGGLCYMAVNFVKPILGYDDSLDVFGMHGVGGTWGMISTGLFASTAVNPDGSDGLFYGYPYQFVAQVVAAVVAWAYAGVMTMLLIKALQRLMPSRVDQEAEILGLDLAQHGEKAYS